MASGLRERLVTALIIGVVVIGVLTSQPAWVALPVIALVFLAGAWEWAGFAGIAGGAARAGYVAAIALATALALHAGPARAASAISSAGGFPPAGRVTLNGFTTVAKLKVPPGNYAITGSGIVQNDDASLGAYVECSLATTSGTTGGITDIFVPAHLSAGVAGGANWHFATTLTGAANSPTRITVTCGSFGPAADAQLTSVFWSLVAIPIASDSHTNYP